MALTQLIYVSRPFGYDAATLDSILLKSRFHNERTGLTGALICRDDIYLQLLEGSAGAVQETYARILRDDRHSDINLLLSGESEGRMFPGWSMRHDPARSWLWKPDEVWAGAPLKASANDVKVIFARVAAEAAETLKAGT